MYFYSTICERVPLKIPKNWLSHSLHCHAYLRKKIYCISFSLCSSCHVRLLCPTYSSSSPAYLVLSVALMCRAGEVHPLLFCVIIIINYYYQLHINSRVVFVFLPPYFLHTLPTSECVWLCVCIYARVQMLLCLVCVCVYIVVLCVCFVVCWCMQQVSQQYV